MYIPPLTLSSLSMVCHSVLLSSWPNFKVLYSSLTLGGPASSCGDSTDHIFVGDVGGCNPPPSLPTQFATVSSPPMKTQSAYPLFFPPQDFSRMIADSLASLACVLHPFQAVIPYSQRRPTPYVPFSGCFSSFLRPLVGLPSALTWGVLVWLVVMLGSLAHPLLQVL